MKNFVKFLRVSLFLFSALLLVSGPVKADTPFFGKGNTSLVNLTGSTYQNILKQDGETSVKVLAFESATKAKLMSLVTGNGMPTTSTGSVVIANMVKKGNDGYVLFSNINIPGVEADAAVIMLSEDKEKLTMVLPNKELVFTKQNK